MKKKQCATRWCRNEAAKTHRLCWNCQKRQWAEKNPVRYAYANLKQNARRRGKDFELTYEQFEAWSKKTEYIRGKGRKSESWHIDRIDESKGYTVDNIQVLSNKRNNYKYLLLRAEWNPDMHRMEFWTVVSRRDMNGQDCPF